MPVCFYSNISIWYSLYINAFVSPMCIEGVIGRCCMCHAWQVRQGSHVAMWHFHNQLERNLRSAEWRSSAPGDAKSFGPAVLITPAVLGYWWKHRWKWPQYTKMISTMQRFDDLNHLASCIILHHPVHLHPESSWIHARGFCDSYQDQCVGNGLCQGGLMWFDVGWQVPKALRCAKMRWEVLRSAERVRLIKMLYSDILRFGHSKKYSCFTHLCFGLLWFAVSISNLLKPFETFWNPCQALSQLGLPVWPSARKGSLLSRLSLLWWTERSEWILRCHRWASDISGTDTSKNDKSMVRMNKSGMYGTVCTDVYSDLWGIDRNFTLCSDFTRFRHC